MPSLQTKALVITLISGDNFRIIPPNCMVDNFPLKHLALNFKQFSPGH